MAGPRDAKTAFVRSGILTVIDGRGNIWKYDPAIVVDAEGEAIVAPAGFDAAGAGVGDNNILVTDAAGSVWTFSLHTGEWTEGPKVDELLEGEVDKTYEPWKRGHNVGSAPVAVEGAEAKKKKSKAA
jgi:hypothetical protein